MGNYTLGQRRRVICGKILPASQLHEALSEADYVVIAAPETG